MNPITHCFASWVVASACGVKDRRDRVLITISGIVPDIDGFGIVADEVARMFVKPMDLYGEYHHVFAHNIFFGLLLVGVGLLLAKRKMFAASLMFLVFNLHILGDILGSRGPDGEQWEVLYLWPFTNSIKLSWACQWALNAWQNIIITVCLYFIAFHMAWRKGYSPIELISTKVDGAFVAMLRRWFPPKK